MREGKRPPEVMFETNDYGRKRLVRATIADLPEVSPIPAWVWIVIAVIALVILAA